MPGCSFSYAAPAVLNTSVSEAAASTVSRAPDDADFPADSFLLSSLLPHAASGNSSAAVMTAAAARRPVRMVDMVR